MELPCFYNFTKVHKFNNVYVPAFNKLHISWQ